MDNPEFQSVIADEMSLAQITTELNQNRFQAWRSLLLAIGACAVVALVYISTATWVWTGGLLLAGSWVFKSVKSLREANSTLVAHEYTTGVALKWPLPTWIKVCTVLMLPITLLLGAKALNTYDPSILDSSSSQTAIDPNIDIPILSQGECADVPVGSDVPRDEVQYKVPCTGDHDFELYYQFDPSERLSSESVASDIAEATCGSEFTSFVGVSPDQSELIYTFVYPSPKSGSAATDADGVISCFVGFDGSMTTGGTLRGYGQ